jgi:hypothetical protein
MFATSIIGFLSQIPLNFTHNGIEAALASIYAEPIHVYPASEILKWAAMVGRAVLMIVWKAVSWRLWGYKVVESIPCQSLLGRPSSNIVNKRSRSKMMGIFIHKAHP